MTMAGLGSIDDIWHWPLHYYVAVRHEYLKIMGLVEEPKPRGNVVEIFPGIYRETIERAD